MVVTTSAGQIYERKGDRCIPVLADGIERLQAKKGSKKWETLVSDHGQEAIDKEKMIGFIKTIKSSQRVSNFVKAKEEAELLEYYFLTDPQTHRLTNLGILMVGKAPYRGRLINPLVIQCIKYDEKGEKVNKWLWDDYSFNPIELVEQIAASIPDWQETYEIEDGLYRNNIPAYDKAVIRELLVNSLVHREYFAGGDVFVRIYPDRVEIENPGRLPAGVTPGNILHKTIKRNEHLAKIFMDVGLMEQEGSGYDQIYRIQLSQGKRIPEVIEKENSVCAVVKRQIVSKEAVRLMQRVNANGELSSKEQIAFGLIAQYESITKRKLCELLGLASGDELSPWLDGMKENSLVEEIPYGRESKYQIAPALLRLNEYKGRTSLVRIDDHRLRALILEDLRIYRCSKIKEIQARIGKEIPLREIRRNIVLLMSQGKIAKKGEKRWTTYYTCSQESDGEANH